MTPKEKAIKYLKEFTIPDVFIEAIDIALEEQKKELTFSGICEVCKKPDEYSEKCLCKDCFKKWVAKEVYHKLVKELDYDDVEKDLLVVFKEYGVKE